MYADVRICILIIVTIPRRSSLTTGQTSTYLVMDVIPKLTWEGPIELAADIHAVEHGCGACLRFKNYKQQTTPRDTHATYSCNGCNNDEDN